MFVYWSDGVFDTVDGELTSTIKRVSISSHFMKLIVLLLLSILFTKASSQSSIDTIILYNVHATYDTTEFLSGFDGRFSPFHNTKKCPIPKDKYIKAYLNFKKYNASNTCFWMQLYDNKNRLIYQGLMQSNCHIGPFKCYYKNGNCKIDGSYTGSSSDHDSLMGTSICTGNKNKIWFYYKKNGRRKKDVIH